MMSSPWWISWRADPAMVPVADRHYNRQKIGAAQFVPPGACYVLKAPGPALWVTSWPLPQFVQHAWPGAWINSLFRREGGPMLASEMIRHAVAHTRFEWPDVPGLGMVTFVDPAQVEHKREPGWIYKKAGFRHVGFTKGGLWVWQLLPEDMPDPVAPWGAALTLEFA